MKVGTRRRGMVAWGAAATVATIACGGTQVPEAPQDALEVAARRVERVVARADEALWGEPRPAMLRRSVADCACPEWEVRLGLSWVRVDLRPGRGADPSVWAWLSEAGEGVVAVERSGETVLTENGWRYPVLEVIGPAP